VGHQRIRAASENRRQELRLPVQRSAVDLIDARVNPAPQAALDAAVDDVLTATEIVDLVSRDQEALAGGHLLQTYFETPHAASMSPHPDKSVL